MTLVTIQPDRLKTPWQRTRGKVIVVLPAYNEETDLGLLLQRIDQACVADETDYEVVIVDDGSIDRTAEIAEEFAQFMPVVLHRHVINQGLGVTIRDGLEIATKRAEPNDVIVAMDADNSHNPGLIQRMVQEIREGNDVVIASRYQRGSYIRGVPFHRQLLSLGARLLFQIAFPVPHVKDYTCGFRAYHPDLLKRAHEKYGSDFVSVTGFQCMVDILLKLRAEGAIFSEVPMILRYDLKGGVSKMRVASTVWATLLLLVRRRFSRQWCNPQQAIHNSETNDEFSSREAA